jgi:demethylmenaquinone methyltransferase/2-methoxy-6-polyprenyl-1,4-benzoquinol methylase
LISTYCKSNSDVLDARVPQQDVGKLYDRTAWFYDVWATLTETKAQDRAIEVANIQDETTILDVAVGTGRLFNRIVERNPNGRNFGIDISKGMLAKAKSRLSKQPNSNYSLDIGSAFDITMENHSIDILFNNYMFDLISFDHMDLIIDEFSRVLKPGGKLVLVNMTKAEQFGAGLYERIYRISPTLMGGCRGVKLSNLLTEHGYKVENREYVQQMLFPSEVILASN